MLCFRRCQDDDDADDVVTTEWCGAMRFNTLPLHGLNDIYPPDTCPHKKNYNREYLRSPNLNRNLTLNLNAITLNPKRQNATQPLPVSFTVSTVHLPNHIISPISLFIPLLSFFSVCVVLFTTSLSFCIDYLLCMLTVFVLGLL